MEAPSTWGRWLVAIVLGAMIATTGDHLHVVYGVLYYPHPVLFQQAAWVLPLFAGATLAMIRGSEGMRRALHGEPIHATLAEAALATAAFFVAYAFTAVAADLPNFVLAVLLLTWGLRVAKMPRWVIAFGLVSAVGGVAAESTLWHLGGFAYTRPDFVGVPRWLPGLYLHASLATPRIRALLVEGGGRVMSPA